MLRSAVLATIVMFCAGRLFESSLSLLVCACLLCYLRYDGLDAAAPLVSQDFDCIVAVAHGTLRVFTIEKLGQLFNQQVTLPRCDAVT